MTSITDSSPFVTYTGPLFDAHLHYEQKDARFVLPEQILAFLDRTGIERALVSGVPDSNTLLLRKLAPGRIVPFTHPFDTWQEKWGWQADPAVESRVAQKIAQDSYVGIGEFNMRPKHVRMPGVVGVVRLAERHDLFLHIEVDAEGMFQLLEAHPAVRVIWAHAGISSSAQAVAALVERFPMLWVELAQRFDVAPSGRLDPAWRALMMRYPQRFMVGSGSSERRILRKLLYRCCRPSTCLRTVLAPNAEWNASRWLTGDDSIHAVRKWLGQLPQEVGDGIAWRNATELFATN